MPHFIHTILFALLMAVAVSAEIVMPVTFGNGMVLQREMPVRVFGKASADSSIRVELGDQRARAEVRDGAWQTTLNPMPAGGPYELRISSGNETQVFTDLMVGEVWLASGQSNMAMALQGTQGYQQHLPKGQNPQLRFLKIPVTEFGEINRKRVAWTHCTPETAKKFSAVAYHFAAALQRRLGVTVGIIGSYRGATWNENWMPRESIQNEPKLKYLWDKYENEYGAFKTAADYEAGYQDYLRKLQAWRAKGGWSHGMVPFAPMGPKAYQRPAGLYECMIKPLQPYAIKGVIWYQGEGNSARHEEFRTLFPAFVQGWRKTWQNPDLPVYFVQLPPFKDPSWPYFRQAQLDVARTIPNCGMIVSEGCGDPEDIHPKVKKPIGDRLAHAASVELYGQAGPAYGPMPRSVARKGDRLIVTFDSCGDGLVCTGKAPQSFELAAADGNYLAAKARIVGKAIEVWSDAVTEPVALRYAWAPFPLMDLFNKAGLPASPFTAQVAP